MNRDITKYEEIYKNNFNLIHDESVYANIFKNMNDEWTVDIKSGDHGRETFKKRTDALDYAEFELIIFDPDYFHQFDDKPKIKRPRYRK